MDGAPGEFCHFSYSHSFEVYLLSSFMPKTGFVDKKFNERDLKNLSQNTESTRAASERGAFCHGGLPPPVGGRKTR